LVKLIEPLMFADDICVFYPSVRGMQSILDVCQAYAESHEIISNCSETVCMIFNTLRAGLRYIRTSISA